MFGIDVDFKCKKCGHKNSRNIGLCTKVKLKGSNGDFIYCRCSKCNELLLVQGTQKRDSMSNVKMDFDMENEIRTESLAYLKNNENDQYGLIEHLRKFTEDKYGANWLNKYNYELTAIAEMISLEDEYPLSILASEINEEDIESEWGCAY